MLILGVLIFALNVSLGVLTIIKKRNFLSVVFGFFAVGFGLWALSIYATLATSSLFWSRLAFFGALCGMGFGLLFSLMFPEYKKISNLKASLILAPAVILAAFSFTGLMVKTVTVEQHSITGTFGPLMSLYQFFAPLYIFSTIFILTKKYFSITDSTKKLQAKYALWGVSLFIGPAILTNAILPLWFGFYKLDSLGPVFSIIMVGVISYAIIRHQLLDIKIVMQRGLIYSTLLAIVIAIYVSLVFVFEYLFHGVNSDTTITSAGITTIIGVFGVPPLKQYFKKITDKIFFKNAYDYSEILHDLSQILNKNITRTAIINKASLYLKEKLKVSSVSFSFEGTPEPEASTAPTRGGISLPIHLNNTTVGWLIIGAKLSNDPFYSTDLRLLRTFASQAAVALEKARLYEHLRKYSKNLEKRIDERTAQISAIQKNQELMMLDISHGLQTPLTVMKGELGLLKKQGYDNKKIEIVERSIDRISTFIYQLLSLSHLDNFEQNFPIEQVNMSQLVYILADDLSVAADQSAVTLTHTITPNITLRGTRVKLEELISNLIENAIKYMPPQGEKRVHIDLSEVGTNVHIVVHDTGIGIAKDDLPKIFEKFYRTENNNLHHAKGAGLGLSICKKIVELHRGTIKVESKQGEGTTFTIILPKGN